MRVFVLPCAVLFFWQEFEAGEEGCAFMDILIPPYDPGADRDCHYYVAKKASIGEEEGVYEVVQVEAPSPTDWDVTTARYSGPQPSRPRKP